MIQKNFEKEHARVSELLNSIKATRSVSSSDSKISQSTKAMGAYGRAACTPGRCALPSPAPAPAAPSDTPR